MSNDDTQFVNRRRMLSAAGTTLALSIAGCLEGDGNGGNGNGGNGNGGNGDGGNGDGGNGGNGNGDDETTYEIGMVDSRTGSLAPYGERNARGMQIALEDINAVGIGDGDELEVLLEDDETSNQGAVNAAQKLVNQDGVPLLIGSVGSGASMAIHNSVAKEAGVVHISQNSTGAVLSTEPDLLRTSPSGAAKGAALAEMVYDDGYESCAVTWINNDYGDSLSTVFEEEYEGDLRYNEPHEPEGSSYRGELSEMADTEAEAWVFLTYADEVTVMVNQAFDAGYNEDVAYYGAESTIADSILENTEPGSQDGFKGITESAPQDQDNYQSYVSRFEEEFDQEPTVWSAYTYDALHIAAIAIEAAEEFTPEALSEVVRDVTRPEGEDVFTFEEAKAILDDGGTPSDVNYEGVSGPVDLDENGDPPGFYQIYTVEDHEYVFGDYLTS